uniref:AAA+ ATPase domain-containing protein n=1 Tax=Glossina palpalis gambiensis TaxID=67801 RepID=A0A1B0AXU3_9MUSC
MYTRKLENMHHPPSDVHKYDEEEYTRNPLLRFHLVDVYERRHHTFLKYQAARIKLQLCSTRLPPEPEIHLLPEWRYVDNLRQCVRQISVPKMLIKTENKLLSYAPQKLREKFPDLINSYMKDVHHEFDRLMKIYSMKCLLMRPEMVVEEAEEFNLPKPNWYYKLPGRTDQYPQYLQNRRRINRRLLILHSPVRAVLSTTEQDFPESLVTFYPLIMNVTQGTFFGSGQREYISYKTFLKYVHQSLEDKITYLRWNWYPKLISIIRRTYKKKALPMKTWPAAIRCIEGLINRQFNNLKQRTIQDLKTVCCNRRTIPLIKIHLTCYEDGIGIDISPSMDDILNVYENVVREIAGVGNKIEHIQGLIDPLFINQGNEFLHIELNENYVSEFIVELREIIRETYEPIMAYIEAYRNKYHGLYSEEERLDLEEFLSEPHKFDEYFKKINVYFDYINKLRCEPRKEYFEMAIVNNQLAHTRLRQIADDRISRITEEIVQSHIKAEEDICADFEYIKDRALEIPKTTEELLANAEYMIYVKKEKLFELRDRIQHCLAVGTNLVELTEMTQYHFNLTIKTINWLQDINEICDSNASQQENYKYLFEEHLLEVIQKLNADIEEIIPKTTIINDMSDPDKFKEYYIILQNFIDQLKTMDDYVTWINKEEKLFKMQKTEYPTLELLKSFVFPFASLMKHCIQWIRYYNVWMDGPFEYLEPSRMIQSIKDFTTGVFIVNQMCHSALRKRHWKEMSEIAGFDLTPDAGTTLRKIINYRLDSKLDQFEIISVGAIKELQLWNNLQTMIHEWDSKCFPTGPYKETGVQILSSLDDIQAMLDDHILKTLTMRGSAFMKPCEDDVRAWYDKIMRVNDTLDQWGKVQANFLYLLPIFSSKDIVAQMPEEGRLFTIVEQTFTRNMGMVLRQPLVMETAPVSGLLESLQKAVELLDDITTGVSNYLEKKRLFFPRFFFLSNDEMLEILSETKDPLRVLPHLSKCFEGVDSLEFDQTKNVLSMLSSDMELVPFVDIVSTAAAGGSVEKWLLGVESEMLKAVRDQMEKSYHHYPTLRRLEWMCSWPQMIVLCVSQIYWAANVHSSLRKMSVNPHAVADFFKELNIDLKQTVELIRSTKISNLNRITIKSLIVIDVHAKDVIEDLVRQKISSEYDFQWMSQLRYYWEENDSWVRIINATVHYANEYLGNSDRLVITPLTDRCYRTLVGAYQLHLNGAPEGPAGTGKTETTKDLAKALAVQCKVFNCSDGLDYKAMGKFFKGLASCGAWACFDEFNRIEVEVLSVVAQQILLIIQAVRAKAVKFMFENTELVLNPACYVCITMNPGYAGRSELPDNLKVLFRSVAMMVPDYAMIGEISLYSYGFVDARKLSVKIVTTYRLCSEQLSMQNHYDYGMRAVKTVLSACGNIKKQFPNEIEDILLLRSLIDVNLPKFMSFDIPLFEGIISDIFPGITLPYIDYTLIEREFKHFCAEMVLEPTESFLIKVIQTYEMIIVRHGFMMVGEPLAGKSKTLQILAKILSSLKIKAPGKSPYYQHVLMGIMNPKSITMNQLYGSFDPVSYEWTDGLVARIYRDFAMTPTPDRKWVIFDGPVDAVWIENMNTVLDDNKKLCLTSGEVITMTKEMSMIFEVMDLAQASPATVSRCGMIYMEPATLGWRSFADCWLKKCDTRWADEEGCAYVITLLSWLLEPCQEFVRKSCRQFIKPGEFNCLTTTFDLFDMCMFEAIEENPEDYQKNLQTYFQAATLFSLIWGVAGILDTGSRDKFDAFLRKIWTDEDNIPEELGKIELPIPLEGILADYVYVFKQRGAWRSWNELAKRMDVEDTPLGVQVPTIDTARYIHLLKMHILHKKRLLFVGPTGTGKSVYIQNHMMNKLDTDIYESAFMTCTVMITANQIQELLISKVPLLKWKRGIYGPPRGKHSILFVDDMNMPIKEEYGAQPPLELLRQYFDYGHVYDLKDSSKIFMHNIIFISACGLPGGSRQDVYPRFLNHFNIFSINTFSDDTMNRIFVNVLMNGFRKTGHGNDVFVIANQIVNSTQQIFKLIQAEMRATPAKSHYIFNLRDIARVVTGCSLMRKETVNDKKIFTRLWYHECMRVFYDRLVNDNDRQWLFDKLNECVRVFFRDKLESVFEQYCTDINGEPTFTIEGANNIFFGVYFDEDSVPDERRYEEVPSMAVLYKLAITSLDDYNSTRRSKMDIILFTFALQHLNRICRIISIGGASALLIGLGGSGRQSLTKLATNMVQTAFFQPEITKNYGPIDWHDDLKNVLKEAGGLDKHTVFLMTENQIKMELFLQDIDCLLNQGEVPNIYAIDEKQEILELVRLAAQGGNRNIDISPLQVFAFFVNRCKRKVHIVLSLSPIGDALRTRVRLYPSLVNCCTIDWYQSWPEEALQMIAKISLESVEVPSDQIKQAIVETCQYFHTTASKVCADFCEATNRYIYLTNAYFLELILSFQSVFGRKQKEVMSAKMRYIGGLETLASAAAAIAIMQTELNALQPKLLALAENSRKMMVEINTETIAASAAADQVKKDEEVASLQAEAAQALKVDCEKDLAQAIPVLEEAIQALNTLKPADITLVKSMKNPPAIIKLVMAAVCVIKGIPPDRIADAASGKMVNDYWGPSKRLLGDLNFLQNLKDFDKDNINPDIMRRIRKEFIPNKDFDPKIVAKASSAAKGLCQWIIAMDLYDNVAKVVAPKKAKLAAAEKEYADTMTFLNEKRAMAAALEAKVAKLNEDLERANIEMKRTQDEADLCQNKLVRAKSLIDGLGGEKSRWTKAAEDLQNLYDHLPGDILLSCGIIAYLSAVNYQYRNACVEDWYKKCVKLKIPISDDYSIIKALGVEITIQSWNIFGLPNDIFSTENAIIAFNSSRYSLFIDPQAQANNWIKNMERKNRLGTVKFNQANYMKVIAEAMEYGSPVIIENVLEELEVPLDPILMRNTFMQGGQKYVSLGDNIVPISSNFRLYMTSSLRNPHYLPETFNKVTIINFALTQSALEDQLLSIVVAKERPDLQELRMSLTAEEARNKAALVDAENMILKTLTSSEGDILEDEGAIQILNESKALSLDIVAKQAASVETSAKIEAFRLNYKPVAVHSSILYYSITDLPNHKKRLLFVGPTGTGKSVYIQNHMMNKLDTDIYESAFMTCTVMITANQIQELLISKLLKWKRGIYGPPRGKHSILFVDDMNMPIKEEYGAQPPLELLRQYFDYGHVYDLKDSSKIFMHNIIFISACGLPGGSRQDVYPRFLNHFNIFSINTFSDDTMNRIFVNVLMNGFRKTGHGNDVFVIANQIVNSTQQIFKLIQAEMRATPAKSHYIFNLRDIARVVTGCSLMRKETVNDKKIFTRLWYHECMRVFYDRLVNDNDRQWLFDKLNECVRVFFRDKLESVFEQYCTDINGEPTFTIEGANNIFFGVYFDEDSVPDERRYEEVPSMAVLYKLAITSLDDYNSTRRSKMDIILFTFALQHLNRICRIISIGGASALLIGLGGSGRQSLTKLATNMVQTAFFQPEITKNYGPIDWHDDLKNVLKEAGGLDKHTVFLMTENQIKMELFLQDIDCLLNQGEVPNIYAIDEKQEILELVRLAAQGGNRNIDISPLQVFAFFVNRCKRKVHIVLSLSPIGDALRTRVRLYPSLVNCCTIDWYQSWPEEALQMIAKISLESVEVPSDQIKQAIVETCQYFHTTASKVCADFCEATNRYIYLTNAYFLELILSFQSVFGRKQKEVMSAKMRYIGGLETLASAAAAIAIMQTELNALQPKLLALAENSRKMMVEINTETIAASAAADQVKKDEEVASLQAEAAQALKVDCEKDLAQAIPVLEEAIQALNTLKPADITLVKSMKNPPAIIKLVMAAVCVIKGIPPDRIADAASGKMVNDYWGPSKRLLGDLNFLQNLKDFDKDNINPDIMRRIRKEFIPNKDFDPKIVAKASSAAKGLCQWIIAMDLYDNVAKVVAPKKAKLAAAEKEYADTMTFLNEKRAMAAALEAKVAKLNEDLERANIEMKRTQDEADLCQNKLVRAKSLIDGLGGEKSRWTKAAEDLQNLYDHLPGDILLSCGIIAYLSAVNYQYRNACVEDWYKKCVKLKIPISDDYSIIKALGVEITIQSWNIFGLPNDIFSTENAIIAFNSSRYSLFIDPQAQANNWIKNMERKNRLGTVKFNQANYMKVIAEAMEYGSPVIIENVLEELEVPLDPILMRNTFMQGGQKYVSLGDNIVPISSNFRLYMTSSLRNPHYLPETFNKVTIINFALTQSALEDQLLSIVVAKERPDLQELRMSLTAEEARNKAALVDAENMILKTLTSSEGDILEDEGAIQILNESKALSLDIVAKQAASVETSAKIEAFRLNYKPVAVHSSILYYSITDLPNVDPMYQFSLNWYINLYKYSIETANKSKELARRIKFLLDAVTKNLYNNVCRSIFEKDKLLFSFILCARILLGNNQIEMRQMIHLLTSPRENPNLPPNPNPKWITDVIWLNIVRLEELPEMKGFVKSFTSNLSAWERIYDHSEPQDQIYPEPWNNKTTRIEKIIILKALRPDKVFLAVQHFIANEIGAQFVTPPDFDISKSFTESTALTPLIFILSPGADPLGALLSYAEKMGYDETFQSISLGQGQGPIAENLIKNAQDLGYWVCLQNCHLAASFMPRLEFLWENMDTFNTSPSFRIWLTSYPTPQFPVALLQNGVKMTNEPPTGLKENIMRSYNSEPINDPNFYNGVIHQDRAFTRLLFGICFFHAVVQERRKYGPLGWNIAYGFNESDLQISVLQLSMLLNQYEHVPYAALSYLTAECNYGGRVTDAWDRRAIVTILADYVNPDVVGDVRYKFAIDDRFMVPRKTEHRDILRFVDENYPSLASPEVYGLHANSGITRDLSTSKTLLDSMILIISSEFASSSGAGQSADQMLLDTINQIITAMPPNMDVDAAKKKYPVDYNESMNTVITQEMERFLKLQLEIRSSCRDIENAIDGIIVMTPELEGVIGAIKLNRIPTKWMKKSYPSLKPLSSYAQDLFKRLNWLHDWHRYGKPPTFWLSGFFFTQAFLTGAMQNFARKYKIPIDTLTFDHEMLDELTKIKPPADGVYVNGLFLEGARWNWEKKLLDEQLPKVLIYQMPAIYLKPVPITHLTEGSRYKSPLYKTGERKGTLSTTGHSTNYVIPVFLNTKVKPTHWVKRSVALLCQTND